MKILLNYNRQISAGTRAYSAKVGTGFAIRIRAKSLQAERPLAQALTATDSLSLRAHAIAAAFGNPAMPTAAASQRWPRRRTRDNASGRRIHPPSDPPQTPPTQPPPPRPIHARRT